MRYIYEHPEAHEYFHEWAGGTSLVTASFFFCNSGTVQRRSQKGLLRTLLFKILTNDKICTSCYAGVLEAQYEKKLWSSQPPLDISDKWVEHQRRTQFYYATSEVTRNSIHQTLGTVKFWLFIDGLDEHDYNHSNLIPLFNASQDRVTGGC